MPSSDYRALNAHSVVLTRDGSRTLKAPGGGEGYKSMAGALTEANHVYLEGSGVAARLRSRLPTRVLEVGFGAGLLFLVTARLAQEQETDLEYVGIEQAPPPAYVLEELHYHELLAPSTLPSALVEWRRLLGDPATPGAHAHQFGRTHLTLFVADALSSPATGPFDAIYHDAFSPQTNPALWSPDFLAKLAARLAPGGRLVSFSVAGPVRRALASAGLTVRKVAGPPAGKREVLVAERPA